MKSLRPKELAKILNSPTLSQGMRLWLDKRVYKLRQKGERESEGYTALVIDKAGLTQELFWLEDEGLHWSCSCGSDKVCAHLWALAFALREKNRLQSAKIRNRLARELNPGDNPRMAAAVGKAGEADLFLDGQDQPSLFFDSPAERKAGFGAEDKGEEGGWAEISGSTNAAPKIREEERETFQQTLTRTQLKLLEERPLGDAAAADFVARLSEACEAGFFVESGWRLVEDTPIRNLRVDARLLKTDPRHGPRFQLGLSFELTERDLSTVPNPSPASKQSSEAPIRASTVPNSAAIADGSGLSSTVPSPSPTTTATAPRALSPVAALSPTVSTAAMPVPNGAAVRLQRLKAHHLIQSGGELVVLLHEEKTLLRWTNPGLSSWIGEVQRSGSVLGSARIEALKSSARALGSPRVDFFLPEEHQSEYRRVSPKALLRVQANGSRLELFLNFLYEKTELSFRDETDPYALEKDDGNYVFYHRDRAAERAKVDFLRRTVEDQLSFERGLYAGLGGGERVADFSLNSTLADFLIGKGRALLDTGFDLRYEGEPVRYASGLGFRAESGVDWFGFSARFNGTEELGESYRLDGFGGEFDEHGLVKVSDKEGRVFWIALQKRDIDRLKLLRRLGMDNQGLLESSPINLSLIESLYAEIRNQDEEHVRSAMELLTSLRRLDGSGIGRSDDGLAGSGVGKEESTGSRLAALAAADPEGDEDADLPRGLRTTLRPYQRQGYRWLRFLHHHRLGGCLADDMGLGKTVQTIALLQRLKEEGELRPSLLITPVLTLPNWEDELARFAPDLGIFHHRGSERPKDLEGLLGSGPDGTQPDLILVSYHTLRNDLDLFVPRIWDYLILDEAHYIKNASSQIFKAIRVLRGKHRLSLTGTPIENSALDLWSQFSFLNPGLLGSRRRFQADTASPLAKELNQAVIENLKETIAPFILRRRKEDVLDDLPSKEESVYRVEMGPEQSSLYHEHRKRYKALLDGMLNEKGIEGSRMDVLGFLLRLRQIAIHPGLASPKDSPGLYDAVPGAKLEALSLMLDDILRENHKVLVFSQFVGVLKLIEEELKKKGIAYAILTGATQDRRAEVSAFQNEDDLKVFLLSLKAGGVGINLTAADYVVIFDPWWNPAAERQAVDRAHRLGQLRPVSAYKFITAGTIEEKILQLQQKKHKLVGSLINGDDNVLSSLGEEDLRGLFD